MTRDEYLEVLATEPLTPCQRGAVMGECRRLGLDDRGERLAVLAAVLGLGELGSTGDLTMGEAGLALSTLQRADSRADLPAASSASERDASEIRQPGAVESALWRFALAQWSLSQLVNANRDEERNSR